MSVRSVLVVLLALVCGGSAAIFVNTWRNSLSAQAPTAPAETVPVVVAAVDVETFTTLTPDMLKTRDFSKDLAPAGAAAHIEDVTDRVALSKLVKDEPVLETRLAGRGAGHGMAPGLRKGMGAFTIQTPNVSTGVAGFIMPHNKVDVLLTTAGIDPKDGGGSTIRLLENVEVLAVDQHVDAPAGNRVDANQMRSVTLLVTPKDAQELALGQSKGTLHLLLRNGEDTDNARLARVTLKDIGLIPPEPPKVVKAAPEPLPPPAPVLPPPPTRIRTLKGSQAGEVVID